MKAKVLVCGGCGMANPEGQRQRHTVWCAWWFDQDPYARRWAW